MRAPQHSILTAIALTVVLSQPRPAPAQGIVTQWNFNSNPPDGSTATGTLTPSIGSGTAALVVATGSAFVSGSGSTDTPASDNSGWNTSNYPAQSTGSGTAGTQFSISTAGQSNLVFRFDNLFSNTANRFLRVEYTTNGGTNWTAAGTFDANLGASPWYNNRTVDLSGVTAANNNPQFAVRVVSIFDPNASGYVAANPANTYSTGGTMRYDAVTLTSAHVWTGGSGTALDTAANFAGGAAPGTTATVLFGTAGGSNTTVTVPDLGTTLDQVVFRSDSPAYTISGTGNLTLNAGLVNNSTASHTISGTVLFGNQNTVYNSGRITLNGDVRFTNGLTLQGTGTTTINGTVLATSGTLTVGPGSTLAGVATTSRPVNVAAGGAIRGGDPNGNAAARIGALTVNGNVTINSTATTNGILRIEASRNTGTTQTGNINADSSTLSVTGNGILNLNPGTNNKITIDIVNGQNPLQIGEAYTILLGGTDSSANLRLNDSAIGSNATIPAANYVLTSSDFTFESVSLTTNSSGTALFLSFTTAPVPEPATVLGIAAGALAVVRVVRRRLRTPVA